MLIIFDMGNTINKTKPFPILPSISVTNHPKWVVYYCVTWYLHYFVSEGSYLEFELYRVRISSVLMMIQFGEPAILRELSVFCS